MKFAIPKRFQLLGTTINVEKTEQITNESKECDGMAFYCASKIELKEDKEFSADYKEFVFWHEYFHHLFNMAGEEDLRKNEKLVNMLANLQMQAIRTME